MKKLLLTLLVISIGTVSYGAKFSNPFGKKDFKSQEIKYQYEVQKEDLQYNRDHRLINRKPTGYMTVEEYEKASEYKEKAKLEFDVPKIETPSDFKYIPKPIYKIVKYNDPPGKTELSLGRRLFLKRQINAQGVVSPDFTKLVYPAIYYYNDSGSTAADMFVIPLNEGDTNLTKILKANVAKRDPNPILSTEKAIDNYAAFRSLTPVDFSSDGTKVLAKEKIGSSEDGIWETRIHTYDFNNKTSYDLNSLREAIEYYWRNKGLHLAGKRWDIYPLGFDASNNVVVQAYGYTGNQPVFLGIWSIDSYGNSSKLVSLDKNYSPSISANGYKIVQDGVETYQTVQMQEKLDKIQDKIIEKQKKAEDKKEIKQIKEDYKYELKELHANFKDEYRDNKKLQTFAGSTEGTDLEDIYKNYQQTQLQKDIQKTQKQIDKTQKQIDKLDEKIQKITDETQNIINNTINPQPQTTSEQESSEEEIDDYDLLEGENEEQQNSD